jgi:hypothetical protein
VSRVNCSTRRHLSLPWPCHSSHNSLHEVSRGSLVTTQPLTVHVESSSYTRHLLLIYNELHHLPARVAIIRTLLQFCREAQVSAHRDILYVGTDKVGTAN